MFEFIGKIFSDHLNKETPPPEPKKYLIDYFKGFHPERLSELFALYRDYLKHEDGLINYRTTWLVSVQSFLIATFGFSYQKKFEVLAQAVAKCAVDELAVSIYLYDFFLFLLVIVGFFTSSAAIRSVTAAVLAIGQLQNKWEEIIRHYSPLYHLPNIIGGGYHKNPTAGAELALTLPKFFRGFWVGVFFFIGFGFYYDLILLKVLPDPIPDIRRLLMMLRLSGT